MKIKNVIVIVCFFLSTAVNGQVDKQIDSQKLEIYVIKETLPQLLNYNPNSPASYLKGAGSYEAISRVNSMFPDGSTEAVTEILLELDRFSDSISTVLTKKKISVFLSDTLYGYKYTPTITFYEDGYNDTSDMRLPEAWVYTVDQLTEVFQTNYENRGLRNPVDLAFIDLVYDQVKLNAPNRKIDLNDLDSSYYDFRSILDADPTEEFRMNAVRLYKPVFNQKKNKACYLFSYQAQNGPFREFVFVEKQNGRWVYIESYGSHHIDSNDDWFND